MLQRDALARSSMDARPEPLNSTRLLVGDPETSGALPSSPASAPPSTSLESRLNAARPEEPVALGSYLVLRRIGAGGMGIVYEARDRHGKRVALKIIHGRGAEYLRNLKNEFRAVADVTAPNLAALYELVAERGHGYFTMEFVDGVDFIERVTAEAHIDGASALSTTDAPTLSDEPALEALDLSSIPRLFIIERLVPCLRQLALGVHALHSAGKLHRDLKPSNVLVDGAGRVVVLDFGLVDDGRSEHERGRILGTPAYMAPEQARGEPAQPASDWYAVGVMLYQALSGRLPFCGSVHQILRLKQGSPPPLPAGSTQPIPEDLRALCEELLRVDPAARPSGDEVLRCLGVSAPGGLSRVGKGRRLLGRDAELAKLLEAFADTVRGGPIAQWIHGGSGVGKSALLNRFLEEIRDAADPLILRGRCYACESVPYKAFDTVIDELAKHLARLTEGERAALLPLEDAADLAIVFPTLGGVVQGPGEPELDAFIDRGSRDLNEVRVDAFRALKQTLRRLSELRPLVIAIDDLHWGDVDSARLLRELLAEPDAPMLLFIGMYRSEEAARSPFLREVAELHGGAREGVRAIALDLLPHSEAKRLALDLLGPEAGEMAETIAAEAGGNAFLIEELARYAKHRDGGLAAYPIEKPSVDRVVLARVDKLAPNARRLLEVVAVAGRSLPQGVALTAAALGAEAIPVVRALETSSLLRADGLRDDDALEVYHDRIRESVLSALAPRGLAEHHMALGSALEATGAAEPDVLAQHFLAAGDRERGVPYALRAAERAASALAFNRAAELYQLVLEGTTGPDAERRGLELRRADALVNAGRCAEAAPYYLACARGAPHAEAVDLRRRAAEQLLVAGRVDEGEEVLRSVLAELDIPWPRAAGRAMLGTLVGLARIGVHRLRFEDRAPADIPEPATQRLGACLTAARGLAAFDIARGAFFSVESLRLALRAGDSASTARSLAGVGSMLAYGGSAFGTRLGERWIRQALDQARRLDDPALAAAGEVHLGITRMTAGSWADAISTLDPALRFLRERCGGYAHERGYGEMTCILALEYMGRLREMATRADACLREGEATGNLYTRVQACLYLSLDRIAADNSQAAAALARDALSLWPPERQTFLFQHWLGLKTSIYGDLYAGRPAAAVERLRQTWPRMKSSSLLQMQFLRIFALQLRAGAALALASNRVSMRSDLIRLAEDSARQLEREGTVIAQAAASLLLAGAAARRGRRTGALMHLGEAITGYDKAGMTLYAAAARRQRGVLLGSEAGERQVAAADAQMANEGIARPDRWAVMYAPGFD